MSFTINRNINFKAIKKNINISNTININSLKESLGSTGSSDFLSLDSLNINNITITANAEQLNYLQVTPGIVTASKALVLDSSKNITGINILTCNTNIIVNNTTVQSNDDLNTGSSDDLNNPYLTNITSGTALASKALVVNSKSNISSINKLTTNNLQIKNNNIIFNNNNEIYNTNIYSKLNYVSRYNYIDNLFNYGKIDGFNFTPGCTGWKAICWSPELKMFVIVGTSGSKRVLISYDGYSWFAYSSINDKIGWYSICWSKELNMFVSGGESNNIMYSYDGLTWLPGYTLIINGNITSICWSPELKLFIAVSSNGSIINSTDGITWNLSITNTLYYSLFTSVCWANNLNLFLACSNGNNSGNTSRLSISYDGYEWQPIYHPLLDSMFCNHIVWSEELNTLVISTSSTPNRIIRSNDGFNWSIGYPQESSNSQWYWYQINQCIWIKELHIFVAILNGNTGIYISYDSIRWRYYSIGNSNVIFGCWSNTLGSLILGNTGNQIYILTYPTKTYLSGFLTNSELININKSNNYVGFGTNDPQAPLHINDTLGKCLRLHPYPNYTGSYGSPNYANYTEFNVLSSGQFDILSGNLINNRLSNINILTNNSTYGLKLNNELLLPTPTEYSYITNITNGTASNSKVLIVDNNLDINNINLLSCSSFIVNGTNIDDSNNNQYLQNLTIGNASSNKALITDTLNNINNINTLKTKKYSLNYENIYGSNKNNNLNLYNLNNKFKIINKSHLINKLSSNNWILSTDSTINSISWLDICWSPELGIFVAISNSGIIYNSTDGINWTNNSPDQYYSLSGQFKTVCWSSKLKMFVIGSTIASSYNIIYSYDGKSWGRMYVNNYNIATQKIIWVNDLELFIAVGNSSSYPNGLISNNGLEWDLIDLPSNKTWTSVCWCNKLNLLVAVNSNNSTNSITTSKDGYNWILYNLPGHNSTSGFNSVCWSEELNIVIAVSSINLAYSYDGINWYYTNTGISINNVIWIKEYNVFLGTASFGSFSYSYDGLNWTTLSHPVTGHWNNLCWVSELGLLITYATSTNGIATNILGLPNTNSFLSALPNQLYFDKINSRLGLGTQSPNAQLELSTDNAAKPSTSTWTIVSDSRLKDNIELANLDECYNVVKNLKLKRYKWKDNIFNENQIYDRTKLGWIADEVENIYPKAVSKKNAYNLNDCKTLNIDQIIASIYGCSQKIIQNYENKDIDILDLENKLNSIENFIKNLELES
jgi:hypothetical protein